MLSYELIHRPTEGVVGLLRTRIREKAITEWMKNNSLESVGLIQGQLSSIIAAMDIAEKAADVKVAEVGGVCPAHVVLIAVMGSAASVAAALDAVKAHTDEKYNGKCIPGLF